MMKQFFKEGTSYALLLSGGLDSTIMFYDLIQSKAKFFCLWIDYGQKNARAEQRAVELLCSKHIIRLQKIFAPLLFDGVRSTVLASVEGEHSVENDELPNRNAVLISIASSHVQYEAPITLLVGAHKTGSNYADATPTFYSRMSRVLSWSSYGRILVDAPYIHMTKRQIVKRAWDLTLNGTDLVETVSCYDGSNCGKCPACKARREAFIGTPFEGFVQKF